MNEDQAIEAAKDFGIEVGEEVIVQSDGQAIHPHTSSYEPNRHVDGWKVERIDEDTYVAEKFHAPA